MNDNMQIKASNWSAFGPKVSLLKRVENMHKNLFKCLNTIFRNSLENESGDKQRKSKSQACG